MIGSDIPRLLLALKEAQELMEQSGHSQNKVQYLCAYYVAIEYI